MRFDWVLNIAIAATGVAVLVGWLRYQRAKDPRAIHKSEISDDLTAGDELLEDALAELHRLDESRSR